MDSVLKSPTTEMDSLKLNFYCEKPEAYHDQREVIDKVVKDGFGTTDPGVWHADRIVTLESRDEILGLVTLDAYDYGEGEAIWIEDLVCLPHPLKKDIGLFSLLWDFILEVLASDFPDHLPICLHVKKDCEEEQRLIGIYHHKGLVVKGEVERPAGRFWLMELSRRYLK